MAAFWGAFAAEALLLLLINLVIIFVLVRYLIRVRKQQFHLDEQSAIDVSPVSPCLWRASPRAEREHDVADPRIYILVPG